MRANSPRRPRPKGYPEAEANTAAGTLNWAVADEPVPMGWGAGQRDHTMRVNGPRQVLVFEHIPPMGFFVVELWMSCRFCGDGGSYATNEIRR
jgi:hypothetical protein